MEATWFAIVSVMLAVYAVLDGMGTAEGSGGEEEIDEDELMERLKSEFDAEEVG